MDLRLVPSGLGRLALILLIGLLLFSSAAHAQDVDLDAGVVKLVVPLQEGNNRVGSGLIVSLDEDWAYIVTAGHVIQGGRETGVIFSNRRHADPVPATVIHRQYWDERGLALLRVPAAAARSAGARPLPLGGTGKLPKGQDVLVVGHPRTVGDWVWLRGWIAGYEGASPKVQANVNEGNSGGPVLTIGESQAVGIVVDDELAGFAIVKSVDDVREYLEGHGVLAAVEPSPAIPSKPIVSPVAEPAMLWVRSNVRGDTVYINGEPHGATALKVELPPGTHVVRVEKPGHTPFETKVSLSPGRSETIRAVLEPMNPTAGETFRDTLRDGAQGPEMVVIPAGSFRMGSPDGETGRASDEGPVHTVRIGQAFALARREVSVGEFRKFVEATGYRTEAEKDGGCRVWTGSSVEQDPKRTWRPPGFEQGDDHPVVCVSWNDAQAYVDWLRTETGEAYRLPSEAEWEYAAWAGTTSARFWGERPDQACDYANVADEASKTEFGWSPIHDCDDGFVYTAPVGSFTANPFGLADVLGNVWEWTEDCWNDSYKGAPDDGSPWTAGNCERRVLRGGSWVDRPDFVRAAFRFWFPAELRFIFVGFRPARTY